MPILTIVFPAFEEENKIARDVQAAATFLVSHRIEGEIIVSDDGSSDLTSERASRVVLPAGIQRIVLRTSPHRGKGSAVRTGVLASRGDFVMFADCGLTVPFDNALAGLRLLRERVCDLAHGSRELPGSTIREARDWDRVLLSGLFRRVVYPLLGIPRVFTDTQCGFKIYRGEVARALYAECSTDGFLFDIEIILRALHHGYRIAEFPVEWSCDRDSRLGIRRNAWEILRGLARLRRTMPRPRT